MFLFCQQGLKAFAFLLDLSNVHSSTLPDTFHYKFSPAHMLTQYISTQKVFKI